MYRISRGNYCCHYKKQIAFLNNKKLNNELKTKIEKFCREEDAHRKNASVSVIEKDKLALKIFKRVTKFGTKAAIEISKRI